MRTLAALPTPSLILDLGVLEGNLQRMAARARALGVSLRPHVKTHKCLEVGRLQVGAGAEGITVSTLEEARAFAEGGFDDILWAFPVIPRRLDEARSIDQAIRRRGGGRGLGLLVDSPEALDAVAATAHPFTVSLKIDCGYHRAGIDPLAAGGYSRVRDLARRIAGSGPLTFGGLVTHSGHAYDQAGHEPRARVAEQERSVMAETADRLRADGVDVPVVSVGSTPAMTAAASLEGIDEARPGNYALYDATQVSLGSCAVRDCAATVLATVVSSSAEHCILDAGALALSKDPGFGSTAGMGVAYAPGDLTFENPLTRLTGLSQEHGKASPPLPVGSRLRVVPNHSCLAVACFDHFVVVRGEEVVDRWGVHRERS